jgi:hypothetical protein
LAYILRQLPFFREPTQIRIAGGSVSVKAYQIIVWISITESTQSELRATTPRLPAILDTGHTHNFSIREDQLMQLARISPRLLPPLRRVRVSGQPVTLFEANIWLHPNRYGMRDEFAQASPYSLELAGGIAVFPHTLSVAPRLPLIGVRSLVLAKLHLTMDGGNCRVSIRTKKRFWFFG